MGIKFRCHDCDKKLHVKAFLAGKRGVCPHCGAKVRIPESSEQPAEAATTAKPERATRSKKAKASKNKVSTPASKPMAKAAKRSADKPSSSALTSTAATATQSAVSSKSSVGPPTAASSSAIAERDSDPISEAPEAYWYVRPPTGGQFGPADGEIMRRWMEEGRVSADSLVWREGWNDWKTGESVFPTLRQSPPTAAAPQTLAEPSNLAQEELAVGNDDTPAKVSRHAKARLPSSSNSRNVAIVVVLSLVCVGLLIALMMILQNQ